MKNEERPTGIIRTLPSLYDKDGVGGRAFRRSIHELETGRLEAIKIALQAIPKYDVLHLYLLIEGQIILRVNIASYIDGDAAECWDKTIRQPKFWAVCSAPVSRPLEPIKRRGFQYG